MGMTNKFHVLTFLNYLAGGEDCSLSIFDDQVSFSTPELMFVGEAKKALQEVRKTKLFLSDPQLRLELVRCFEMANFFVAEVKLPQRHRSIQSAVVFEFSEKGICRIRAYYPSQRSLSLTEEYPAKQKSHVANDISLFLRFLESGQKDAFFKLFEDSAIIQDAQGRSYGDQETQTLEDFWVRYARTQIEIYRYFDGGRFCAAETKWRSHHGIFVWTRSEGRKILSCHYFANEKLESQHRLSSEFMDLWESAL